MYGLPVWLRIARPGRPELEIVRMANTEPTGGVPGDEPNREPETTAATRSRRRPAKKAAAAAEPSAAPAASGAADVSPTSADATESAPAGRSRRRAKAAPANQQELPIPGDSAQSVQEAPESSTGPAKRTRKRAAKKAAPDATSDLTSPDVTASEPSREADAPREAIGRRARGARAGASSAVESPEPADEGRTRAVAPPTTAVFFMAPAVEPTEEPPARTRRTRAKAVAPAVDLVPEPPPAEAEETEEAGRTRRSRRTRRAPAAAAAVEPIEDEPVAADEADDEDEDELDANGRRRRRRGRRGRGRGKGPLDTDETESGVAEAAPSRDDEAAEDEEPGGEDEPLTRRRRRRRRSGAGAEEAATDDGVVTVVRVRQPRPPRDEVQGVTGSTRLEAKRQRRRDGREQRRTRPPILSESEFLARREAVDRVMVVRQKGDRTQVAVLEDGILVEHYVTRQSANTMVGNVYLGKVQNVLPSMEAAFVDIGRGRNAVLYAGEVNWDASGLEGRARSIEQALKSGESVLVQVTKDPVGHKGARLTSHVALSGRHLVYVPNGHASGISRKLSDVERRRLRDILKNLLPDGAGVIVRTAAEGAAEQDLERDVRRLQAQWEEIQTKAGNGGAPALLSAEPDLVIRVVRDLFNEDFREVVIQGSDAYDQVEGYLAGVSPDLVARVRRHTGTGDVFAEWRIDEQILKGLDRKVYLPSGGHLVIDRTEAMTVVDVNTGKYTGAGGNLEETVTRNNLEAAEEIVRQLRLRDLGGIVVIDFIDMVLESNRELVLRRLTECLGRDRTKHQVTEITSLGLVQMTRKRIGQGLLEAFSETCDHCKGRGVIIQTEPVPERSRSDVAEKVRAMAASNRTGGPGDSDDAEVDEAVDAALPDPELAGELAADYSAAEYPVGDLVDEDGNGASARRRARRGGSRRRTRP
jgi:ribonuclease E